MRRLITITEENQVSQQLQSATAQVVLNTDEGRRCPLTLPWVDTPSAHLESGQGTCDGSHSARNPPQHTYTAPGMSTNRQNATSLASRRVRTATTDKTTRTSTDEVGRKSAMTMTTTGPSRATGGLRHCGLPGWGSVGQV